MQTGTNFSESFQTMYEDERSFLERTVNDYPASPFSLFLLLQNYKNSGDPHFGNLEKKATVYFQNHAWLNYQLSGDELMIGDIEITPVLEDEIEIEDEEEVITHEENSELTNEEENHQIDAPENTIEQDAIQEMEDEEKVEFVQGEDIDGLEEVFVEKEIPEEAYIDKEQPTEEFLTEKDEEKLEKEDESTEISDPEESELQKDTIQPDPHGDAEESNSSLSLNEEEKTNHPDNEEVSPETTELLIENDNTQEKEDQELEFEPLHTIDYFASQGIIIKEDALINDKLGKQVKSFTDWLKSMKKLHPGKLPEQNEVVERIIQSSAELSNEDAGILTESMAEVLLKQGKKQKAIEMFEKLSLMNPSKSIYFAAKIESLKNK